MSNNEKELKGIFEIFNSKTIEIEKSIKEVYGFKMKKEFTMSRKIENISDLIFDFSSANKKHFENYKNYLLKISQLVENDDKVYAIYKVKKFTKNEKLTSRILVITSNKLK